MVYICTCKYKSEKHCHLRRHIHCFLSFRFCSRWRVRRSGAQIFRSLPQYNVTELRQCQLPVLEVRYTPRELDEPGEGLWRRLPALARHLLWTDHFLCLVLVFWSSEYSTERGFYVCMGRDREESLMQLITKRTVWEVHNEWHIYFVLSLKMKKKKKSQRKRLYHRRVVNIYSAKTSMSTV